MAFVGLLLVGVGIAAQTPSPTDDLITNCVVGTPAQKIAACTTLLNTPNQTPNQLESNYESRGDGYRESGQYALAMQDYAQALQLIPGEIFTIYSRGKTYDLMGQYDLAIADFTTVLAAPPEVIAGVPLKPETEKVLVSRAGILYFGGEVRSGARRLRAGAGCEAGGFETPMRHEGLANFEMQNWFLARGSYATLAGLNAKSVTATVWSGFHRLHAWQLCGGGTGVADGI